MPSTAPKRRPAPASKVRRARGHRCSTPALPTQTLGLPIRATLWSTCFSGIAMGTAAALTCGAGFACTLRSQFTPKQNVFQDEPATSMQQAAATVALDGGTNENTVRVASLGGGALRKQPHVSIHSLHYAYHCVAWLCCVLCICAFFAHGPGQSVYLLRAQGGSVVATSPASSGASSTNGFVSQWRFAWHAW